MFSDVLLRCSRGDGPPLQAVARGAFVGAGAWFAGAAEDARTVDGLRLTRRSFLRATARCALGTWWVWAMRARAAFAASAMTASCARVLARTWFSFSRRSTAMPYSIATSCCIHVEPPPQTDA